MKNNHIHERVPKRRSSNGYIDKPPSDRHRTRTKQSKATQTKYTTSTNASEPPKSTLDTDFESNHEQHQLKEEPHRRPLASNTHYLLPTASSLQHRISPFILSPPARDETKVSTSNSYQIVVPPAIDETSTDQHSFESQLEQDQDEAARKQRMESKNVVQLYARYLQWEWVALKLEKRIAEQKLHVKEQLLEAKNSCTDVGSSSDGRKWLQEWEETYLLPIQEDVGLLESNGLDAVVADTCLSEIKNAISQLNHFKEKIPQKTHDTYMAFLEDCFHYMQDIYKDMINISYASLLDTV